MDSQLLTKAINFHGQELMRLLHEEQGADKLSVVDLRDVNYLEYHRRASDFGFQHRIRRQKFYQFIARKADKLFIPSEPVQLPVTIDEENEELYAIMPPLENFMGVPGQERKWNFFQNLKKGDILVGKIFLKGFKGCYLHLLCFDGGKKREIHDLTIKAFCPLNYMIATQNSEVPYDAYQVGDILRGVVSFYSPGTQRITVATVPAAAYNFKMGLISDENLPLHYRKIKLHEGESYSDVLEHTLSFNNPTSSSNLCLSLGLSCLEVLSIMDGLHNKKYPPEEYSSGLRRIQSSKWAYKSVRDGVSHFKAGNYTEAFQSLNKALQIDQENVEALVARGALFANKNNLHRAVEDFEKALSINNNHSNAQKYLSETLVALGKDYEEKKDYEEAAKTYKKAIDFNINNFDAKNALAAMEEKRENENAAQAQLLSTSDSISQNALNPDYSQDLANTRDKLKQLLRQEIKERLMKRKHPVSNSSPQSKEHFYRSYDYDPEPDFQGVLINEKYKHEESSNSYPSSFHTKIDELEMIRFHSAGEFLAHGDEIDAHIEKHNKGIIACRSAQSVMPERSSEMSVSEELQELEFQKTEKELPTRSESSNEELKEFDESDIKIKPNETSRKKSPKIFFVLKKEQDLKFSKLYGHAPTIDGGGRRGINLKKNVRDKAVSFFFSGDSDSDEISHESFSKKPREDRINSSADHLDSCSSNHDLTKINMNTVSETKPVKVISHSRELSESDSSEYESGKLQIKSKNTEHEKKYDTYNKYERHAKRSSSPNDNYEHFQSSKHKKYKHKSKEHDHYYHQHHHHHHHHKQNRSTSYIDYSPENFKHASKKIPFYDSLKSSHKSSRTTSYSKNFDQSKKNILISRAPDPEVLKRVQRLGKPQYSIKHSLPDSHSIASVHKGTEYDSALAAARKINEQLKWNVPDGSKSPATTSTNDSFKPLKDESNKDNRFNSNYALQQMESFLQKLRDTKRAKTLASTKH